MRVDEQRARAAADVAGAEELPALCGGSRSRLPAGARSGRRYTGLRHAEDVLARGTVARVEVELRRDAALQGEVARRFVGAVVSVAGGRWPLAEGAGGEERENDLEPAHADRNGSATVILPGLLRLRDYGL